MINMTILSAILNVGSKIVTLISESSWIRSIIGKTATGLSKLLSRTSKKKLMVVATCLLVGFLSGWTLKPVKTEIISVASPPELIDRPVRVVETLYVLPPLNCSKADINPHVGGLSMSEYVIWGQKAWNWIADCSDSIIDFQTELDKKNKDK